MVHVETKALKGKGTWGDLQPPEGTAQRAVELSLTLGARLSRSGALNPRPRPSPPGLS